MSISYTISPLEEINWRVNIDDFIKKLHLQWPTVQVYSGLNPNGNFLFIWEQGTINNVNYLSGRMFNDQLSLWLDTYFENAVEFALWYRKLIPEQYKLVFFDQGYNCNIEMQMITTEQDIQKAFA